VGDDYRFLTILGMIINCKFRVWVINDPHDFVQEKKLHDISNAAKNMKQKINDIILKQ